jgi:hypothetical protein
MFSKWKTKKLFFLFSCVFVKNYHILEWDFKQAPFLAYFSVLWPCMIRFIEIEAKFNKVGL